MRGKVPEDPDGGPGKPPQSWLAGISQIVGIHALTSDQVISDHKAACQQGCVKAKAMSMSLSALTCTVRIFISKEFLIGSSHFRCLRTWVQSNFGSPKYGVTWVILTRIRLARRPSENLRLGIGLNTRCYLLWMRTGTVSIGNGYFPDRETHDSHACTRTWHGTQTTWTYDIHQGQSKLAAFAATRTNTQQLQLRNHPHMDV
ncbi:hypothetical protein V8F20_011646 [Naviculisporaceae sp. PSN 640]